MSILDAKVRSCKRCGEPFTLRTGSGGSAQLFCDKDCRRTFHRERLRRQRTGSYAGQLPEPAIRAG
jgi:hypothetical protein